MKKYDAIIIGAGQAGVPLARKLAEAGWKTALVEKRFIGGTCINDGCTPTKTMIASGRMAYHASKSDHWGVEVESYRVNMSAVKRRKEEVVASFREGAQRRLQMTDGLELIFGEAKFTGHKKLAISLSEGGETEITAERIFINTGASPVIPNIPGIREIPYLTSTTLLDLELLPGHLLILGGGYISLELGQLYHRLGSKVTILEKKEQFLSHEDEDIASALRQVLEEEGITIHTGALAQRFRTLPDGTLQAVVQKGEKTTTISCTHLLVAVGRSPQSAGLNLDQTGITPGERGHIPVNDRLETSVPGIYALGDVKGGPAFTHIAYHDYLIVYKNLLEGASLSTKDRLLPYCVYTDPQLGRVGLSEQEARRQGYAVSVASLSMANVARAIETGETRGLMKAVVDSKSHQILGAAILGAEGGEIMSVLQVAIMGKLPYDELLYGVFAHPTFAESLNNLFMTIDR